MDLYLFFKQDSIKAKAKAGGKTADCTLCQESLIKVLKFFELSPLPGAKR